MYIEEKYFEHVCLFITLFIYFYDSFSRKAYWQPTSCRPHLLLVGKTGYGQASHLAPAVLHALEMFPVHTLDMSVLFVSMSSPEETCAQVSFFLVFNLTISLI